MNLVDCYWFTNLHYKQCMGIVKMYDNVEEKYKYYVGFGDGKDEKADIKQIIYYGTKYTDEQFKTMYGNLINAKYGHY